MSALTQLMTSAQAFIEKASRPGVLGLVGQKLERGCARDLKAYFLELKTKVEALHLEDRSWDAGTDPPFAPLPSADMSIWYRLTNPRFVEAALSNLLRRQQATLVSALKVNLQTAYLASLKMDHMQEAAGEGVVKTTVVVVDKLGAVAARAGEWASTQAAQLVTGIDETTIDRLASVIEQGIEEMRGPYGTGQLIRAELEDMSVSRALTIASTEINRAMSAATLDKLDALGVEYKQWILDADPCELCIDAADDGAIPADQDFTGDVDGPPMHPNCFSGLEKVTALGVSGAYKRWFEGKVLSVRVATDDCLIVTVNHPILTDRGWVAAGQLKQGDELMHCLSPRLLVAVLGGPHDNLVESMLEKVPDTLRMTRGMSSLRVPGTAEDFHGDGTDQEVDVVLATRFLESELQLVLGENRSKAGFGARHFNGSGLASVRTLAQRSLRPTHSQEQSLGARGILSPLFGSRMPKHHELTAVANGQTSAKALVAEDVSPVGAEQLRRRLTGLITPVKVIEIIEHDFRGHVYNLQTESGWYLANSIITHNCRCAVTGARAPDSEDQE